MLLNQMSMDLDWALVMHYGIYDIIYSLCPFSSGIALQSSGKPIPIHLSGAMTNQTNYPMTKDFKFLQDSKERKDEFQKANFTYTETSMFLNQFIKVRKYEFQKANFT